MAPLPASRRACHQVQHQPRWFCWLGIIQSAAAPCAETVAGKWLMPEANFSRHRQFWGCLMVDFPGDEIFLAAVHRLYRRAASKPGSRAGSSCLIASPLVASFHRHSKRYTPRPRTDCSFILSDK
jgi:hypothetical protein